MVQLIWKHWSAAFTGLF